MNWAMVLIGVLIAILLAVFLYTRKGKKQKTDYYSLFTIGIIWVAIGIPLKNVGLWGLGLAFMVVGLVHKSEWKQNIKDRKKLNTKERKKLLWILTILGIVVLLGFVAFSIFN
ncbi:hypothetical protein HN592_05620 [Candidatus Woesearchaeota archaeon]|jgi:formate hydrogenlyase subunit 3/multisubunit Na+/H+ antiporter MnhD subunit|nr:hypothetical protein [Candidatus Woesearchaeota archaeon]MBT3304736.1 hypothetical protein [Candidatus Woesearchaeota archaeon]MBT4367928.1 hypothetical protein [Candidatus Woesearchaeota archaeon]MBT4712416.1 hypothetical protein [Candidatus Woesearchaeota archaeon]MBT6639328.1 hypothetical protein [Candidatus Woesearchaeota archaeon]